MSKINTALAILTVLAFFLPFITVSCNNKVLVQVSGAKLVQCSISPCSGKDFLSPNLRNWGMNMPRMNAPADPSSPATDKKVEDANFVLFAAIASLIAVIGLFIAGRGGELLSGVASTAVIVMLLMFRSKFSDAMGPQLNSPELKNTGMILQLQLQFASGFWLTMMMSACSAILAFKGSSAKSSVTVAAPIGGSATQPPMQASSGFGQQTSVCPSCGASNTAGNKFCLSCGASLAAAPPPVQPAAATAGATEVPSSAATPTSPPQQQQFLCPSCGATNSVDNKFCLACGASLMANVLLFQPKETTPSSPPPEPMTAVSVAPHEQQGGDLGTLDMPATMAAAAAASPANQPLPQVAPSRETPEPPATTSAPGLEVLEHQPSLDWEASPPESPKPPAQSCAACGAAIGEEQKFCLACGAPVGRQAPVTAIPNVAEPEPTIAEVCAACNTALSPGQKFCLSCGTPVALVGTATQVTPAAPTPAAATYPAMAETQLFQAPGKSSPKTLVVVVVLLVVLGAGGWYGWKYFARPDVTVITFPQKTHVAVGGKTSLQASVSGAKDTDINWSIQEGNKGGQVIDWGAVIASGQLRSGATYNAPQRSGVFHVIATSHANPSRSAKIEIVVGGSQQTDMPTPPPQPTPTSAPASSVPTNPMAEQIVGRWRGPSPGMQTIINADSTMSMTSETETTKNLNGTYRFTDKSHLDVDFGNGDVRKWEIVGVDSHYLRVTSQSKDGTAAIIFEKIQ